MSGALGALNIAKYCQNWQKTEIFPKNIIHIGAAGTTFSEILAKSLIQYIDLLSSMVILSPGVLGFICGLVLTGARFKKT